MSTNLPQISSKFNAADADVILVSSDEIHFKVHRTNLIAGSPILKDLLEVSSTNFNSETVKVEMSESSNELLQLLPYFYPSLVPPKKVVLPGVWTLVKLADKFEVYRAFDALALGFWEVISEKNVSLQNIVAAFVFASQLNYAFLRTLSFNAILKTPSTWDALSSTLYEIQESFDVSAHRTRLVTARIKRKSEVTQYRRNLDTVMGLRLHSSDVGHSKLHKNRTSCGDKLAPALSLWLQTEDMVHSASIEAFLETKSKWYTGCSACVTMITVNLEELKDFMLKKESEEG
ncbi:hypothetical protein MNV49_004415 [Pseudohyphozyma bogoriensis]|nr:hypothetical protein MNV49_004415 [Pseudohyphozyma bogoriensis]